MNFEENDNFESYSRLVEYHLGLLSSHEIEQIQARLETSQELRKLSDQVEETLAPLEKYEVDVPVGLDRKIKLAVRTPKVTATPCLRT